MRIACPSCAAGYEVPASRLTPGKMVRCARCGGEWVPPYDAEEAPSLAAADPTPDVQTETGPSIPSLTAMDRLAAVPPRRRSPAALRGAWAATLIVLVVAIAATMIWQQEIIRVWPPSGRILMPARHATAGPAQTAGKQPE